MARITEGWIKVNRKIEANWIAKDVVAYALWLRLLMWANFKPTKYREGGELKTLERGQILTSLRELANSFSVDKMTISQILTCLKNDGMIRHECRHQGSIITICNYELYQCSDADDADTNQDAKPDTGQTHNRTVIRKIKERKELNTTHTSDKLALNRTLVQAWNENCGSLAQVQRLTDKRETACKARLKEEPDINYWVQVVKRIASSEFCLGGSQSGWRASFDWFLKPDTHVRVMEGKYDNRAAEKAATSGLRQLTFDTRPVTSEVLG